MSGFLLDTYPAAAVIKALFHTYAAAGGSVTATGLAATDIEIYKDGSTTQRSSDNGYTVDDDFDSVTGVHLVSIDLGDNTDAGFYAAGSQYTVVVSSITVDSQTVSFVLGSFRIMATEHTAGYPVATIKDGTGTGEIDTTSGGVLVAAIASGAITATAIAADAIGASELAADAATEIADAVLTRQMTESYAANGAAPTLAQSMFAVHQYLMTFAISGTSYTVKKLDGSTSAFVVTLNDATDPSAAARS